MIAPSCTISFGAVMVPMMFAVERISIRCVAVISPFTLPHTTIESAQICAIATALSPIVISLPSISPSMLPSMRGTRKVQLAADLRTAV